MVARPATEVCQCPSHGSTTGTSSHSSMWTGQGLRSGPEHEVLGGGDGGIRRGAARSSGGDNDDRQRQEAAGREGHGKRDDPTSPVVMGYRELGLDTPVLASPTIRIIGVISPVQ